MANEKTLDTLRVDVQYSAKVDGVKDLVDLANTLNAIARGTALPKYLKEQSELIEELKNRARAFNREATSLNAEEFVNVANALQGRLGTSDFSGVIKNYDKIAESLSKARDIAGQVVGELTPEAFHTAFGALDALKAAGVELNNVFEMISRGVGAEDLAKQYDHVAEALSKAQNKISQIENGKALAGKKAEIEELKAEIENFKATTERAKQEYLNFLSVNDIDPSEVANSDYRRKLNQFAEDIENGMYTAHEAIAKVRSGMSDLFQQTSSYGLIDVSKVQDGINATEQQASAIQDIEGSAAGLKATSDTVVAMLDSMSGGMEQASGEARELQQSLLPVLNTLNEMAHANPDGLDSIRGAFYNLSRLGDLKGSNKSLQSLVSMLKQLASKDVDLTRLSLLSDVRLTGFKDVKVSKTILYIGELSKNLKNVDGLEKLSNMQFENLQKIKIDKSAISSIRDLAEAIKVLREAKAASITVTDDSIAIEENEASKAKKEAEYLRQATQALRDYYGMLKQLQAGFESGAIIGDEVGGYHTDGSEYAERVTQLNQYLAKKRELIDEVDREAHKEETLIELGNRELALNNQVLAAKEVAANKQIALSEKQEAAANRQATAEQTTLLKAIELQSRYSLLIGKMSSKKHGAFYTSAVEDRQALDDLIQSFQNGEISLDDFKSKLQILTTSFNTTKDAVNGMSNSTMTAFQRLATMAKKFSYWFSVTRIVMAAYRAFKQMVQSSIELESTFNQLQIVTGATDAEMSKFADTAINLAKGLGQSVTDVTKAIETFSRLGYTLSEAGSLAEFATILSNVANVDLSAATTGLTSIIKGFDMEVSDAEHVSDVLINVGQKFAVSASEMMDAYERAGAALNATNTSFEKSAALIAAANASVDFCRAA